MYRRRFIQSTTSALVGTAGFSGLTRGQADSWFVGAFGYDVADFFTYGWDKADLKNNVAETVDTVCYAYGKIDQSQEMEEPRERGFLSQLQKVNLADLKDNPDMYDWLLKHLDNIAEFLGWLDVIPDGWAEEVSEFADSAREITKFVPLFASVKGLLDTGCVLHEQMEAGKDPAEAAYLDFFKQVALTIVEIIILASSVKVAYQVAFGATGWVNRRLIHVVGRSIGWRAYSWVLSQVHWGIRIVFTEGMDQTINATTADVANAVVTASRDVEGFERVPQSKAMEQARSDVVKMAKHTDEGRPHFELWAYKQKAKQEKEDITRRAERIKHDARSMFEELPF